MFSGLDRRAVLVLCLAGCTELRTPVAGSLPPLGLVSASGDPGRAAIADAALAWAGVRQGDATGMARAAALLEWLAAELPRGGRWAPIAPRFGFDLGFARAETRQALAIRPDVPPAEVISALAAAARDPATPALRGPGFAQGSDGTAARLAAPGTLSLGPTVTANLLREVTRLDAINGWNLNPVRPEEAVRSNERSTGGLGTYW